jgi:hypothetical protein
MTQTLPKYGSPEWDEFVDEERLRLARIYGSDNVYYNQEVTEDYKIRSFLAPFVFATRRSDGKEVVLDFQHSPRFYWYAGKD